MSKLNYIDFIADKINIKNVFKNEVLLDEIKKNSLEKASLPKISEIMYDLYFPKAPENRPYTICSVVLSADGKMAFTDSSAGPLIAKNNYKDPDGALADFWVLNALRAHSDGIIIGAKTLQHEKITSHVYDKDLVIQRKEYLNKSKHPCGIIVSFDATDIPFDHMIFEVDESEEYKVAIATSPAGAEFIKAKSRLKHIFIGPFDSIKQIDISTLKLLEGDYGVVPVIITGTNNVPDSGILMYILKNMGMNELCIESPSYNWHLMKTGCLDEYFINYSMVYAGGDISPGYSMPFGHVVHPHADLLSIGVHTSSFMYTRQKLLYDVDDKVDMSLYKY